MYWCYSSNLFALVPFHFKVTVAAAAQPTAVNYSHSTFSSSFSLLTHTRCVRSCQTAGVKYYLTRLRAAFYVSTVINAVVVLGLLTLFFFF